MGTLPLFHPLVQIPDGLTQPHPNIGHLPSTAQSPASLLTPSFLSQDSLWLPGATYRALPELGLLLRLPQGMAWLLA